MGVEKRRAAVQPREIDMRLLEREHLVVALAGPGIAPAHRGAGRPDQLDGAPLGVDALRHQPDVGPGLQRQIDGGGVAAVRRRGRRRHSVLLMRLVLAGAGRPAGVGVEGDAEGIELGVDRGDLGQHLRRLVALAGDRLLQRHDAGAHREDVGLDVLHRIDRLEARRGPVGGDVAVGQLARGLRRQHEAPPDRLAEAGDQQLPLQRLHPAAELDQPGPDRGVVHLAEVAGQQLVGEPDAGGDGMELHAACTRRSRPRPRGSRTSRRAPARGTRSSRARRSRCGRRPASVRALPRVSSSCTPVTKAAKQASIFFRTSSASS